jgi:hypothetical protein
MVLWTLLDILLIIYLLGLIGSVGGDFIHLILGLALLLLLAHLAIRAARRLTAADLPV